MQYKVYKGEETKILNCLELELRKFSEGYVVNEWRIPALISGEILKKCGYFETMPNQLTLAGYYDEIACGQLDRMEHMDNCNHDNMYLTPAACIHFYPELQQQNMKNELITTNARVYRRENGEFSKVRLWDFNVREFVAIGDESYVHAFLEDFMRKALELALKIDSNSKIVIANDHFYPTRSNMLKEMVQRANGMKYELLDGEGIAIASFNYHGFHFSETFEFDNCKQVVTGCVGFGLDRWLELIKRENGK